MRAKISCHYTCVYIQLYTTIHFVLMYTQRIYIYSAQIKHTQSLPLSSSSSLLSCCSILYVYIYYWRKIFVYKIISSENSIEQCVVVGADKWITRFSNGMSEYAVWCASPTESPMKISCEIYVCELCLYIHAINLDTRFSG